MCVCVCVRNESELKARIEYISCLHPGALKLKIRAATLVMRQGWPLPQCHISSENLTWHVCIGFLHLPFKALWAS